MKNIKNIVKLTDGELCGYIRIGFCQQKYYKRSAWETAVTLMEYLADNGEIVIRKDHGHGKGKYSTNFESLSMQAVIAKISKEFRELTEHITY